MVPDDVKEIFDLLIELSPEALNTLKEVLLAVKDSF